MSRRHARGFTLIELLVVVVIIATILSVGILSIRILDDDRLLETEARRLGSLINAIQDEAAMQGRDFGLELMTGSYRFVEYDAYASQWIEVGDIDLMRLRELPEEMEFDLVLEGKRIVLAPDPAEIRQPDNEGRTLARTSAAYAPHIFILSSGDITPFELMLMRPSTQAEIAMEADFLGSIRIGSEIDEQ